MRLLLDINIFLDVVFGRPGEAASSNLIGTCGRSNEAWVAWHSVATLAYLVERQQSAAEARQFIREMLAWTRIAPTVHEDAVRALDWPMPDYEDALQAAAAIACNAGYIITRNKRDFAGSPVPALTPEDFFGRA
ncbi:MAG: PIN domain-containing protein [Rhodocyclaceae bacterium]|nr:PIN domain-containing protein [Rhodocyclaceae bacterium]